MDGIINVLKPPGMTSADVVYCLRRLLQTKKIGHTGTLDPGVAGVLPICVGKATRLAEYLTEQGKEYRAEITFGIATDTQDAYGTVIHECQPLIKAEDVRSILPEFTGEVWQIPPMFSAVRKEGKRLYEYARSGVEIERTARAVRILRLSLRKWRDEKYPRAEFDIECSKGTYVRTLCHDLGERLGCGAHMSYLMRLRSGPFSIVNSWTLEEIEQSVTAGDLAFLLPLSSGLDLPLVSLTPERARAFCNGLSTKAGFIAAGEEQEGLFVQVTDGKELLGIGLWRGGALCPHKVITMV